jgi:hypothetical protein
MTITTCITERARGEPGRRPRRLSAAEFQGPRGPTRTNRHRVYLEDEQRGMAESSSDCSVRDTRLDRRGVEAYLDWARDPC